MYDKYSGEMIGFTHLGDINDELLKLEKSIQHPPIATYVLSIMVRAILFKLDFPYAHFGSQDATADFLCGRQCVFLKLIVPKSYV